MQPHSERIVVTGGAGFIGSHLVDRFLNDAVGHVVVVDDFSRGRFTNLSRHSNEARLTLTQTDVRDLPSICQAIDGASVVVHLAARTAVGEALTDADDVFTTNVGGTFNVLRAAARFQVRRVVFASSCAAYGTPITLPVDEDHPLHAADLNGASKVSGEAYCRAFRRVFGLQSTILRFSEVYGPRDSSSAIAAWIDDAQDGRDLLVADTNQLGDFIWIDDAIEAIARVACADTHLPPINVASGTGTRLIDIARRIARLAGTQPRVRAAATQPGQSRRFVADVERMRRMLGLEPSLDPLCHLDRMMTAADLVAAS
jgi:UDP-glucose 4-epimerase